MAGEWWSSLALSGASTLVSAAATDTWKTARAGFLKLFAHGDPQRERIAANRLDEAAAQVESTGAEHRDEVREALVQVWRVRLGDLLEEQPDAAEQVRALIEQVYAALPAARQHWAQAIGTGAVITANSGGVNIANSGAIGDITLRAEPPGTSA